MIDAMSTMFINLRLNLIAHERGLDREEVRLAKRTDRGLYAFAERHRISIDWLLFGDLRGLQRTIRWVHCPPACFRRGIGERKRYSMSKCRY
jgi:hypothetical protein